METFGIIMAEQSDEFSGAGYAGEFRINGASMRTRMALRHTWKVLGVGGIMLRTELDGDILRVVLWIDDMDALAWFGGEESTGEIDPAYAEYAMDSIDEWMERLANGVESA